MMVRVYFVCISIFCSLELAAQNAICEKLQDKSVTNQTLFKCVIYNRSKDSLFEVGVASRLLFDEPARFSFKVDGNELLIYTNLLEDDFLIHTKRCLLMPSDSLSFIFEIDNEYLTKQKYLNLYCYGVKINESELRVLRNSKSRYFEKHLNRIMKRRYFNTLNVRIN